MNNIKLKNQQQTDACAEHDRRKAKQVILKKCFLFCFTFVLFCSSSLCHKDQFAAVLHLLISVHLSLNSFIELPRFNDQAEETKALLGNQGMVPTV